jgi:hypothetical protein
LENSSQYHDSPTDNTLLNCSTTCKENPFLGIPEIGKYLNNLTNTDLGWWRHQMDYFQYAGSELILNSLGLGREAVL